MLGKIYTATGQASLLLRCTVCNMDIAQNELLVVCLPDKDNQTIDE